VSEEGEKEIGIDTWTLIMKEAENRTPSGERERMIYICIYIYVYNLSNPVFLLWPEQGTN